MVQSGEADIAVFLTPEQCATIDASDGLRCESVPSSETLFMRFDTPSPVLGDQRIRKAIVLAVDSDLIIDQILGNIGTPAAMIIGPSVFGWDPDLAPAPYDPDMAKQLIDEAKADGVPVDDTTLLINVRQASIPRIAEVAQAVHSMLTEVGLNVDLQIVEASIFNPQFAEKPTPERHFITMHPHGNELFDFSQSNGGYYTCASGASGVCDPALDEMIYESWTLAGQDREQAFHEQAKYIDENVYTGHIAHLDLAYGINDRVQWNIPLDHRLLAKDMSLNE
jgi:peptide/nickel transport system substrate-binding protein